MKSASRPAQPVTEPAELQANDVEAVQYREFGPWHAVMPRDDGLTPSDTTLCGRSAIAATRMYQSWVELDGSGVCRRCFQRAGRIRHLARCSQCKQTMGKTLLSDGLMPTHHTEGPPHGDYNRCPGSERPYEVVGIVR